MAPNPKLPATPSPALPRQPQPTPTNEGKVPRLQSALTSKANGSALFLTGEEWLQYRTNTDGAQVVFGSPTQAIVRAETKNLIVAAEKSYKTSVVLRMMLGLSAGRTVFPQLPVLRPRKVLYVHGELSPQEIKERTRAAAVGLPNPLGNFVQGRDLRIHLGKSDGQKPLKEIVAEIRPDDLVLDPWQGFIPGFDENEFRDVSRATHFMDMLIAEFGVTIYLVTHTGKDHSRGTRGHSSLAGWRDTIFNLERKKELVTVKIEPRWAAPVEPFNLEFRNGTVWPTDKSGFTRQAEEIRKFLRLQNGFSTRKQIAAHLGADSDAVRKALKRAQEANAIVIDGNQVRLPEADKPNAVELLFQD